MVSHWECHVPLLGASCISANYTLSVNCTYPSPLACLLLSVQMTF